MRYVLGLVYRRPPAEGDLAGPQGPQFVDPLRNLRGTAYQIGAAGRGMGVALRRNAGERARGNLCC